jgi:hypothetical protein
VHVPGSPGASDYPEHDTQDAPSCTASSNQDIVPPMSVLSTADSAHSQDASTTIPDPFAVCVLHGILPYCSIAGASASADPAHATADK